MLQKPVRCIISAHAWCQRAQRSSDARIRRFGELRPHTAARVPVSPQVVNTLHNFLYNADEQTLGPLANAGIINASLGALCCTLLDSDTRVNAAKSVISCCAWPSVTPTQVRIPTYHPCTHTMTCMRRYPQLGCYVRLSACYMGSTPDGLSGGFWEVSVTECWNTSWKHARIMLPLATSMMTI